MQLIHNKTRQAAITKELAEIVGGAAAVLAEIRATQLGDANMNQGTIVQCIGAVVDVEFARNEMPKIYDALKMDEIGLTLEVQQQLGDGIVRTIALGSSDGLRRGMTVVNTGNPIMVPVGGKTLGRIMDVLGRPIDERGAVDAEKQMSIHRDAPVVRGAFAVAGAARDRHQGDRPLLPVRQGRQGGPVRRRRRGQDGRR